MKGDVIMKLTFQDKTNTVNTKDWLEATKGLIINSFVDPDLLTLDSAGEDIFTKEDFEYSLRKVCRTKKY